MRKVIPKNIADEMTKPYIDDAVEKQIQAADVPPRNKLDISFKDAGRTDDNKDYESNQEAYEKNHGKLYDMTHNNTIPWKNYVVYIVLLSLLTCVFTFSKYMSNATGTSSATIASFKVDCIADENLKVDVSTNKGTIKFDGIFDVVPKTYTITLQNYSDVSVIVTWNVTSSLSNVKTVTIAKKDTQTGDVNGGIYIPAGKANTDGSIAPSTRDVTFTVEPTATVSNATSSNMPEGNLGIEFTFDQVD